MSNSVKVTLYAVLVLLASISGYFALTNFGRMMARAGERHSDLEQIEPERKPADDATADTNASATAAPSAATNAAATGPTNAPENTPTNITTSVSTNTAVTNAP